MNGNRPNGIVAPDALKARPLDGVRATPPLLYDGLVPNVYALLSPVRERPAQFEPGSREYDPMCLGYQITAVPASDGDPRACLDPKAGADADRPGALFTVATSKRGNRNTGHEFAAGTGPSVIGPALMPAQRMAITEFLKTDEIDGRAPTATDAAVSPTGYGVGMSSAKRASR